MGPMGSGRASGDPGPPGTRARRGPGPADLPGGGPGPGGEPGPAVEPDPAVDPGLADICRLFKEPGFPKGCKMAQVACEDKIVEH